jgi:hypothetical protein
MPVRDTVINTESVILTGTILWNFILSTDPMKPILRGCWGQDCSSRWGHPLLCFFSLSFCESHQIGWSSIRAEFSRRQAYPSLIQCVLTEVVHRSSFLVASDIALYPSKPSLPIQSMTFPARYSPEQYGPALVRSYTSNLKEHNSIPLPVLRSLASPSLHR